MGDLLILWHERNYLRAMISNVLFQELCIKTKTITVRSVLVSFSCLGVLKILIYATLNSRDRSKLLLKPNSSFTNAQFVFSSLLV